MRKILIALMLVWSVNASAFIYDGTHTEEIAKANEQYAREQEQEWKNSQLEQRIETLEYAE